VSDAKVEELQRIINDATVTPERREEAKKIFVELQKQSEADMMAEVNTFIAKVKQGYEARTGQPFPKNP
jgi:hypothetical protein